MIVERDDKAEFEMSLDDTRSNTLARAFTDQVALVSDLPNRASNGYLVNVSADPSTVLDDRWLAFQTFDNSDLGEGGWRETVAPGILFRIDENTMPYVIRRQGLDDIHIGPADGTKPDSFQFPKWAERCWQ